MTYGVLYLARPHVVELVVRQLGRSLRQLGDIVDDHIDGLLRRLEHFRNCASISQTPTGIPIRQDVYSRLATGVECALESTKETLRSI